MPALLHLERIRAVSRCRIGVALVALAGVAPVAALTPVADLDLNRYYGTWYEIAAIPGFLQSRCARDTRLEYSAAENGAIATKSSCVRTDGSAESNEGQARVLDPGSRQSSK